MNEEKQHTPAEEVAMQVFGVLYAVLQHHNTPLQTKMAIVTTMEQVMNNDKGPFQTDDDMNELGQVFTDAINKQLKVIKGEAMLNNILNTDAQLN